MYRAEIVQPESFEQVEHHVLLGAIAAFLRPELYVELGANGGATFKMVAPHAKRAIAVDIEPYEHFFEGIENGTFVRSDTVEFLKTLGADAVDFCFLDSSHDFEVTRVEFAELNRVVRPNGVVVFHDSYPAHPALISPGACGGVCDAIALFKVQYADTWEFSTLPAQYGLTISRRHMGRQLLWRDH